MVTEITTQGYFSRIKNSIKGIIFGCLFFFGSIILLWWNEGNLVRTKEALVEMGKTVVPGSASDPSPLLNGKLIHAQGELATNETLGDDLFLVAGPYLKVARTVEMYQWVEEEKSETREKVGGSTETRTTYTYEKRWKEGREDSSSFRDASSHQNPPLPFSSDEFKVTSASFGSFDGMALVDRLSADSELTLDATTISEAAPEIRDNFMYVRKQPGKTNDEIGDVRVKYHVLRPGNFSIMATQASGTELVDFQASNGKALFLIGSGKKTSGELLAEERSRAGTLAWILRAVGAFFNWLGLMLILNPLAVVLSVLPPLGSLGRGAIFVISLVLAAVISVTTIVVAMIFYNIWALIICVALVMLAGLWWMRRKAAKSSPPPAYASAAGSGGAPPPPPSR